MPRPRTTTWFSPLWYAHHAITDTIEKESRCNTP